LPLALVTYNVLPIMSVTVPEVIFANAALSPLAPLAPLAREPLRAANGNAEAVEVAEVDE
jgi:hypothetical protein